ncbi:MAG TPA: hypothetical protein VFB49_01180 [Patescibacteria group bacterium]|nr:hypothetical protein [Patescibacteria group bacterium]
MRQRLRDAWRRVAAAITVLTAASMAPCLAASSIPVPGGGSLTVEAVGLDRKTPSTDGRSLSWTYTDAFGVRTGVVPSTSGDEPDVTPVLAADPRSGAPILIWSHWDGQAMKLTWSRFDSGSWSDPRPVTFGPGNDRSPAVGVSSAGAYLFFWRDNAKVFYAPLDLGTGRLFAAPRLLGPAILNGRDLRPNGGTDVPIIGVCGPKHNAPCVGPGLPPVLPGKANQSPGIEGGTDVPIVITSGPSISTSIGVASEPACSTMLVGVGRVGDAVQRIVGFDGGGRAWLVARIQADGVTPSEALAASASYYLGSTCR